MLELWPVILFGWPAILVALALSVMGVVRRRPKWLVVAAIVVVAENFCQVSALHPIAVVEVVTLERREVTLCCHSDLIPECQLLDHEPAAGDT